MHHNQNMYMQFSDTIIHTNHKPDSHPPTPAEKIPQAYIQRKNKCL